MGAAPSAASRQGLEGTRAPCLPMPLLPCNTSLWPHAAAGFLGYELTGNANNAKCTAVSQQAPCLSPPGRGRVACLACCPGWAAVAGPSMPALHANIHHHLAWPAVDDSSPPWLPSLPLLSLPTPAQLTCTVGVANAEACSDTKPSYAVACAPGYQVVPKEGGKCVKVRRAKQARQPLSDKRRCN